MRLVCRALQECASIFIRGLRSHLAGNSAVKEKTCLLKSWDYFVVVENLLICEVSFGKFMQALFMEKSFREIRWKNPPVWDKL